jgi:hypothetical protein
LAVAPNPQSGAARHSKTDTTAVKKFFDDVFISGMMSDDEICS